VTTQVRDITADELLQLPDAGFRYELIRGELKKMAPAGNEHGSLAALFTGLLITYVRAQRLGKVYAAETGFKIASDPDTVRAPDVAFISQKRLDEVGPVQGYWPGAPDLAVEVISPSDLYTEVSEKVAEWLQAGSKMVVVVNPRTQQVLVHLSPTVVKVFGVSDTLEGGEVVPGWQLSIAELFGD
jgi:Uma2 family endonuclease